MEDKKANFTDPTNGFESATKVSEKDIVDGALNDTRNAYEKYSLILDRGTFSKANTQYLFMAKAIDDLGMAAEQISNSARLCNDCTPSRDKRLSGALLFGIVFGMLIFAAVCALSILGALVYAGYIKLPDRFYTSKI